MSTLSYNMGLSSPGLRKNVVPVAQSKETSSPFLGLQGQVVLALLQTSTISSIVRMSVDSFASAKVRLHPLQKSYQCLSW